MKYEQVINVPSQNIAKAEAYSKRYNFKFYNISVSNNKTQHMLLDKLEHVFEVMDLNLRKNFTDNIHRLPAAEKGPRPVIVKFVSKIDRNFVWEKKSLLERRGPPVFIKEHVDNITEKNIYTLLLIKREAIRLKMIEDRLTINSKAYTVKNLH